MNFFKLPCIIFLMCVSLNAIGYEILSKFEAKKSFNKTFTEWKNDAEILAKTGLGEFTSNNEISITMIGFVGKSILKVTPAYTQENITRPWKISVAVEQDKELTKITKSLGDDGMRQLVNKWYKEMLPEFTVMTEFDTVGETLQINFNIFEFGSNKIIDEVGKETLGCWQGCIKK